MAKFPHYKRKSIKSNSPQHINTRLAHQKIVPLKSWFIQEKTILITKSRPPPCHGFPVRNPQLLEPKCDFKMSSALLWLAAGLVVGAWALNDTSLAKQYALRTVLTQVCTNNKPPLLHCGDSPNRNQRTNEFLIYGAVALNQKPQVP